MKTRPNSYDLSKKELEVLTKFCLSTSDIAKELVLSLSTVKTYIHRILKKTGTSSRTGALIAVLKEGILTFDDIDLPQNYIKL
jgi:DNA-binding NarL/FixJ family response regulator